VHVWICTYVRGYIYERDERGIFSELHTSALSNPPSPSLPPSLASKPHLVSFPLCGPGCASLGGEGEPPRPSFFLSFFPPSYLGGLTLSTKFCNIDPNDGFLFFSACFPSLSPSLSMFCGPGESSDDARFLSSFPPARPFSPLLTMEPAIEEEARGRGGVV